PKTAHAYEKAAKEEVSKRIDAIAEKGRDPMPREIKFVTYTLRYNQCGWVTVEGLERHWEPARVEGGIKDGVVTLRTKNVTAMTLQSPPGTQTPTARIDGGEGLPIPQIAGARA